MNRQAFSAPVPSLVAQSLIQATGFVVPVNHCKNTTHVVTFGAGTSAGSVVVESADSPGYSGTWTVETTLAWAAATSQLNFVLNKRVGAVRHRLSIAAVGGTISSSVQGEI